MTAREAQPNLSIFMIHVDRIDTLSFTDNFMTALFFFIFLSFLFWLIFQVGYLIEYHSTVCCDRPYSRSAHSTFNSPHKQVAKAEGSGTDGGRIRSPVALIGPWDTIYLQQGATNGKAAFRKYFAEGARLWTLDWM